MAFSSGVFSRLYSWTTDKLAGTKIRADRMDAEFDGMATALSTCILKDGTQTITAAIPFNNQNITGVNALTAVTVTTSGASTATAFIPSSSTVPTNGMYLPAANTVGFAINSAGELQLTATALSPITSDGLALGTTALQYSDLFLAEGGVINWDNGDATLTQVGNMVTLAGADLTVPNITVSSTATLSGAVNAAGNVTIAKAVPLLVLNRTDASSALITGQRAGVDRWTIYLGEQTAESGSNAGSDFYINRFSDAGALLANALFISRANGAMRVFSSVASASSATGALRVDGGVGVVGAIHSASLTTGTILVTAPAGGMTINAETVGQTGTLSFQTASTRNWDIHAQDNAALIIYNRGNTSGVQLANQAATSWSAYSSRRIKDEIEELSVLDSIERFRGVRFRNRLSGAIEIGIVAEEFAPLYPELVKPGRDEPNDKSPITSVLDPRLALLTYDRVGAIALQGVKELLGEVKRLKDRVDALEARP